MSIKQIVLDLCKERNVRVGTLERETGMSNGTIRQWTDSSTPSMKTLTKIADYFSIPVTDFLPWEAAATNKEKPDYNVELSESQRVLVDRVMAMSEDQAAAFLRMLDAFQATR